MPNQTLETPKLHLLKIKINLDLLLLILLLVVDNNLVEMLLSTTMLEEERPKPSQIQAPKLNHLLKKKTM
jgi:hypothetical protein